MSKRSRWFFRINTPEQALIWLRKHREMDPKETLAKRVLIVAKRGTSQGTGVVTQHADESVQNVISMVIMLVVAKEGKA